MSGQEKLQNVIVFPGYVCVPQKATFLKAVVASGIVITLYDTVSHIGGMCYYTHAIRENNNSSPRFAAPAILSVLQLMEKGGATRQNIECYIYGGAVNEEALRFSAGASEANVRVGKEILTKAGITSYISNTGGGLGRKIIFNSGTGEAIVATVNSVRKSDWYPSLTMKRGR